jgi:DNA/RNA-binding domain of Phe-tRNA-synthetase-like protein
LESDELEPQDDHQEVADSTGETAEQPEERVARLRRIAAQVDTQPSLRSATERLRRRLPGDERFGDAMSTAGAQPSR